MGTTVVLVHGAWHGAWCWDRVVDGLSAAGVDAVAIDLPGHGASREPLGDLHGDAAALRRALDAIEGPVVACGHSYGGAVLSEGAAGHPAVRHLVFLASLMLDVGESCGVSVPDPPVGTPGRETQLGSAMRFSDDGEIVTIDAAAARDIFYGDCSDGDADWAIARLGPQPSVSLQQSVPAAAWRAMPSTYVVCDEDHAIPMWMQRAMSERASDVVVWPTSHSPFLSRPDLVVALLADLAAA